MTLATIDDYELLTGTTVAGADRARVERLLAVASDQLLGAPEAFGQEIAAGTTTAVLRPIEGVIRFPQRPVTAVTSVTVDGTVLAANTDYRWTPGGDGQHAYLIRRRSGVDGWWESDEPEVSVAWAHGWSTIPDRVVAAVVAMVHGVVRTPAEDIDVQSRSETVAGYQIADTYAEGRGDGTRIPGNARSMLERLCGVPGPVSVPTVRVS